MSGIAEPYRVVMPHGGAGMPSPLHIRLRLPATTGAILLATLLLAACSGPKTRQAPTVRPSGFLGDYSRLRPGTEGEALLVYRAPDVNLAPYRKAILDRVAIWASPSDSGASRGDLQRLADSLYGSVLARLRTYYIMADEPGPDVIRIRAALTEAKPSSVKLDILSNIGPITGTVARATEMTTGTRAFVGAASVEVEVSDSESGQVLLAAADRRVGTETLAGSSDPWSDVDEALQIWADRLIVRLQAEGGPRQPLPYWAQPPPCRAQPAP